MASKPDKVEIYLRRPVGDRASFVIIRRINRKRPDQRHEQVRSEALAVVNELYQDGTYTLAQATKAAKAEVKRLREIEPDRRPNSKPNSANARILNKYWKACYASKDINQTAARDRLNRAILAVGDLHISTASQQQLQTAINRKATELKDVKRASGKNQRDIVAALNQLLQFLKRTDVKLIPFKKTRRKIKYFSLEEFRLVADRIEDPLFRDMAWAAFATGGRAGELFALTSDSLNTQTGTVWIEAQIDKELTERETKNRRLHHAPVIPEGMEAVRRWCSSDRAALRKSRHADMLRVAIAAAFPSKSTHYVFHDLRHSYAVHLLRKGVSIDLVAQALGDSVLVAQEYYLGFALTSASIETVSRLLK